MAAFELDTHLWPIVVLTLGKSVTDQDYRRMFAKFESLLERCEPYLTITDTTKGGVGDARQRRLIGEWIKEHDHAISKYSLGSIIIVQSSLVRGALTAIQWISPWKMPSFYVADMTEALAQARAQLAQHGIALPVESRAG